MNTSPKLRQRSAVPAVAVRLEEAASALGVSVDFFNEHVRPEIRLVRRGRILLVPVSELEKWIQKNAAYAVEL